ncbi:MAG: sigma-70 family RNA polymerase sigma factor [Clostridia bacterium]|nr:sigma-70 family RNA polymerase sigma factor [Clostridia bacterium]
MKQIFYILDPNGEFYSTDRTKRYRQLTGQALVLYLRSSEAKKKYFEVWKMDKYTLLGVEVPEEKVKEFAKEKRRRKYVNEVKKEMDISITSLDVITDDKSNIVNGEEALALVNNDTEEKIVQKILEEELHKAIASLSKPERILIKALFFKGYTERQLACKYGVSQVAIHKRKQRILEKLKKILEEI